MNHKLFDSFVQVIEMESNMLSVYRTIPWKVLLLADVCILQRWAQFPKPPTIFAASSWMVCPSRLLPWMSHQAWGMRAALPTAPPSSRDLQKQSEASPSLFPKSDQPHHRKFPLAGTAERMQKRGKRDSQMMPPHLLQPIAPYSHANLGSLIPRFFFFFCTKTQT